MNLANMRAAQDNATNALNSIWERNHAAQNDWLRTRQTSALESFNQQGFPNKHLEDWRYTDLRELAEHYPLWLENSDTARLDSASTDIPQTLDISDATRIVFINGVFRPELSDALPDGLFAGSTEELAIAHPKLVQQHWGRLASDADSGMVSLNSAFANASVALTVADGAQLTKPIYVQFAGTLENSITHPRLFVDLGENSTAELIEHYSSSASCIVNAVTEISCGENAHLKYYKLQEEHPSGWHTAVQYIHAARNSNIKTAHIDLGARLSRNDLKISLQGESAHVDSDGVFIADGQRHVESRITVNHMAPHTTSRERFRSILADNARGVFNGRIYVDECAQKTNAQLSNRNLLLSPGAEINTKPELEIYADDVKCAHGSTTGQLDTDALFYLLSRGIPEKNARDLLIMAFASELVTELEIGSVSEKIQQALRRLGTSLGATD